MTLNGQLAHYRLTHTLQLNRFFLAQLWDSFLPLLIDQTLLQSLIFVFDTLRLHEAFDSLSLLEYFWKSLCVSLLYLSLSLGQWDSRHDTRTDRWNYLVDPRIEKWSFLSLNRLKLLGSLFTHLNFGLIRYKVLVNQILIANFYGSGTSIIIVSCFAFLTFLAWWILKWFILSEFWEILLPAFEGCIFISSRVSQSLLSFLFLLIDVSLSFLFSFGELLFHAVGGSSLLLFTDRYKFLCALDILK